MSDTRWMILIDMGSLHWYLALIYDPAAIVTDQQDGPSSSQSELMMEDELPEANNTLFSATQDRDKAFIVIFDSLGSKYRRTAVDKIKTFILTEAKAKLGVKASRKSVTTLYPRLPLQSNLTDCGCFLLEYVDRFLQDPEGIISRILQKDPELSKWFTDDKATSRRWQLKQLIEKLEEDYRLTHPQSEVVLPSASSDIEEIQPYEIDPS